MTEQSPSIAALAAALVNAQEHLTNPPKDSANPHFKSKFADLATVRNTVTPVFRQNGLAVTQLVTTMDGGKPALATMLLHKSGEWLRCTSPLSPVKNDPQGMGSAITYARRYALQALANVCGEDDDDGHHASSPPRPQQHQQAPPARPAAPPAPPAGGRNNPTLAGLIAATIDAAGDLLTLADAAKLVRDNAAKLSDADKAGLRADYAARTAALKAAAPTKSRPEAFEPEEAETAANVNVPY